MYRFIGQLDKIGMGAGHLPMVHPFSMSLNEISPSRPTSPATSQPADRPPVSRKDLLDAISDRTTFDKLYVELSQKTIQAYQTSGRKRCALKLHAGLAGLEKCVFNSIVTAYECLQTYLFLFLVIGREQSLLKNSSRNYQLTTSTSAGLP